MFADAHKRFDRLIWNTRLDGLPLPLRFSVRIGRYIVALFRDMLDGQLTLRAMSLVYTTLLSLVPLLALSFSVLKGFGVHRQVQPLLFRLAEPLGPKGEELAANLVGFVDNVRVDVLGSVGLAFLLYMVISLVRKIEDGFNHIWRVRPSTNFATRMSAYISVILIGPVLIFTALGLIASISSNTLVQKLLAIEPFGTSLLLAGKLVPFILVIAAFLFIYIFIPNNRVQFTSALTGAAVAGVLWSTTIFLFSGFAASTTRYDAIYSGFAVLILFMILLYLNWLILLLGAQISFYHQNPQFLRSGRARIYLSNRLREELALLVMYLVGEDFSRGQRRWTANGLSARIGLPGDALWYVINALQSAELLIESEDDKLLPGRDLQSIRVVDIVRAVRSAPDAQHGGIDLSAPAVESLMSRIDKAIDGCVGEQNLRELVAPSASTEAD
ncbi:MAG: YihY/virulence factor BrkB family protein [Gammaproteobacteria bacterium]|nr:YihY/virulence factor BrkB family protein [Gammaproteobacteria bacterium]